MAKTRPSDEFFRSVNKAVLKSGALDKAARDVAARATRISRANGGTANYSVRTGIRPGGRAFADVVSDNRDEERGSEEVPRINALRRAARGER